MALKSTKPYSAGIRQATKGPEVFDYLDYRAFLRDHYLDKKQRQGLSFRGFSKRAGLKSPNYLKLVIDGQRNLTEAMAGWGPSSGSSSLWKPMLSCSLR